MSVPGNNVIPPHPGVAAQVAAAGPAARVAQDNQMIPGHPQVAAQLAQARGLPQAPAPVNMGEDFTGDPDGQGHPQSDWFAAAATGQPTPQRFHEEQVVPPEPPPVAQRPPVSHGQPPQQPPTYSEIDALLEGIQLPGEVQAPQPGVPQGQPQQGQVPAQGTPPVSQPQQQPQVASPQAPPAAAPPQFDAEAAQRAAIDQLMGRDYALSEADQRRLIAEPETVIPRLAAQVHVNVVRDIGQRFGQIVPQIVETLVERRLQGMRNETEFYSKFPKLNHPSFRPIVEQSLSLVKANNPNISQDQLHQMGASYAAFQIRQHYRQAQAVPPAAPQAPAMRAPGNPYVPMTSGAPPVPQVPGQNNAFDDLSRATDLFDW